MDGNKGLAKAAEIGIAVVAGSILIAAVIGFVPITHPIIAKRAVEFARRAGADSCSVRSASITFWKGVTLRGVCFTAGNGRCAVNAGSVTLRGNVFRAAVWRTESMPRFFYRKDPLLALRETCRAAGSFASRVMVSGAGVIVADKTGTVFKGQDCSIDILFSGKDLTGSFAAASLAFSGAPVLLRVSGEVAGTGDAVTLTQSSGKVCGGKIQCAGRLDFAHRALGALTLSINGFDFDEWYRDTDTIGGRLSGKAASGRLTGKVDARLVLDSSALAVDSLRGKGTLSAVRFEAMNFSFQKTLAGMLGYPGLLHLRFRKCSADCTVKPGGIIKTEASGDGDSLCIKLSGWFGTNGALNENAECTVTRAAVNTLPEFARKTLEETRDGGRVLRLRIFGSVDTPKFEIDSRAILQKAVKNMFEEVRDNLQKWLQ
jgi:hypothetical protein